MQTADASHHFVVACCKRKHRYNLAEVIRLEASSNYTRIHALNQRPLVVAKVLSAYEEELVALGFMRVHRSHLINLRYVSSVDSTGKIVLNEGFKVEVPRRKKKEILRRLGVSEVRA